MSYPVTTEPPPYGVYNDSTAYSSQSGGQPQPWSQTSTPTVNTWGPTKAPGGAQGQWMPIPTVLGCPPGLEYLSQIDQLVVKQQVELLEVMTGWETNNKYRVFNKLGQQIYFAAEETSCCQRQCCGPGRGFIIHITDNMNKEVMRVIREFKCCAGCCWCAGSDCCAWLISVVDSDGHVFGYVRQSQSSWKPKYIVMTPEMETVGHINGPCCVCSCPCCGDVDFPLTGPDHKAEIGQITKQWSGAAKEMFSDADNFSVSFPMDMDVRMKATFLGALFLVDFMYFEKKKDNNKNHH